MVTIPHGDYSSEKIIIAKIEPETPELTNYNSQLDLMQIFTDNIVVTNTVQQYDNIGLLANDRDSGSYIPICTLENNGGNLSGYTRLGISAEFQSLLNNTDTVSGNYGLKFYVYSVLPTAPGEAEKDGIYELYLDAEDMIGDPYSFSYYSKQEKVIDISMIESIRKIEVYFYQNGNFKNSSNQLIDWQYSNNIIGLDSSSIPNNLFVRDLQMYLGYEVGSHENDRMIICCEESTIYSYTKYDIDSGKGPIKHLSLKWLHKFDDQNSTKGKYELVNMITLKSLGYTIKWFRYNLNTKNIDKIAGRGWEEINVGTNNRFECTIMPDINLAEERIKVIAYKTNITYESSQKLLSNQEYLVEWQQKMDDRNAQMENIGLITEHYFNENKDNLYTFSYETYIAAVVYDPYAIYYQGKSNSEFLASLEAIKTKYLESIESVFSMESEEIVLKNAVKVYDSVTFNASSSLSIYYEDGSEGNYYIYDSNGRLINAGQGRGYERRMRAVYNGHEITPSLGALDWITWYLPIGENSKTMILNTKAYQIKDGGQVIYGDEYQGVQYICIRRYADALDGTLNTWQSYSINNNWNNAYTNNLIRCEVSIDGVRYMATNTMRFGKAGTQGTNTTLILEMVDNYNAITVPVPKDDRGQLIKYEVVANPYDVNGNLLDAGSGSWSWGWKSPMTLNARQQPVIEIEDNADGVRNKVTLLVNISNLTEVASGYYGILYATYTQANGIPLTAYLSIPLKAPGYSHIEGASEITYTSGGAPQYYSDAYKIFLNNDSLVNPFIEVTGVNWDVVHDVDFYKKDKNGKYVINQETGEKEISAMCADYIPKLNYLVRKSSAGTSQRYQGLQAAPFFAEGYDQICITCSSTNGEYDLVGKIAEENFYDETYYYYDNKLSAYKKAINYDSNLEYYVLVEDILWVQPLLITKSNYDYSVLNEWDGSLTTDEGSGTIMATMLGAGRKNEDNTFSGVLMGDVKDMGDISDANYLPVPDLTEDDFYKDIYYYKNENGIPTQAQTFIEGQTYYSLRASTGLYGFQNGEISFALKDSGIATFGKSSRGQIIIDGEKSTISSKGYSVDGNGMLIDMDDGILSIKDNGMVKVKINPQDPYLQINGLTEKHPIMHIGGEECYLQSANRGIGALGTKFDLVKGILDISGTGGKVYLSGVEADPFFEVTTREGSTLIHMDVDDYYLQSAYFEEDSQIRKTKDNLKLEIYKEKTYVPIVISLEDYNNNKSNYYSLQSNGTYVQASGSYNDTGEYYRKGKSDVVLGYDFESGSLYNLTYDTSTEEYKAGMPVDIYEEDSNGNFIYPILFALSHYEKDYNNINLDKDSYIANQYYITDGSGGYILSADEFNENETYYEMSYIPVQFQIPDVESESMIPLLVQRYVERELEPVMTNSIPAGMKLDLVNGRIEGYNLKLVGTKINESTGKIINRLVINTEDDSTPVQIGGGFSIGWDGTLSCTRVKTITNTGKIPSIPTSRKKGIYGASATDVPSAYFVDHTIQFYIKEEYPIADNFENYYIATSSTAVTLTKDTFVPYAYYYLDNGVWKNAAEFDESKTYSEVIFTRTVYIEGSIFNEAITYYNVDNPVILTIGGNNVFNGMAASANTANTAAQADIANKLAYSDDDWNNIFDNHGNKRYATKTAVERAYGPLNISWNEDSLATRVTSLENSMNNSSSNITNNYNAIAKIEKQLSTLSDTLDGYGRRIQAIEDKKYEDDIKDLYNLIESLQEQINNLKAENPDEEPEI